MHWKKEGANKGDINDGKEIQDWLLADEQGKLDK